MILPLVLSLVLFCFRDYFISFAKVPPIYIIFCLKCISGRRYRYFNYLCRRCDCFDFVALFYKELQLTSFDPTMAQAYGLNIQFFHYALMFY